MNVKPDSKIEELSPGIKSPSDSKQKKVEGEYNFDEMLFYRAINK